MAEYRASALHTLAFSCFLAAMPDQPTTDVPDSLFGEFPPVSREEWEAKIRDDLRGTDPERVLRWDSLEGVSLRAYYRADDLQSLSHMEAVPIVEAGSVPANRWRVRQDITASDLESARRHARMALDGGVTDLGLHVRLKEGDLHGLPVQQQSDLNAVLADVDLTRTPIHVHAGVAALPLLGMLCNTAEAQGIALASLQGSIDYDPLAALIHHRITHAERAFDLAAQTVRFAAAHLPSLRTCTVDLRPYHDAGASIVQELGGALGSLSEQLAQLRERGHAAEETAGHLQLIVPLGTSYFMAIAKLRALRLTVPQVLAAYDVSISPDDVFIQAVTSRRTETIFDPYVNMLRATTEAASAVIGGCDVLTVRPYTAAYAMPDDFAQRLARNTQLILQHEAHLDDVADPGAGSYYLEALTDKLARASWNTFQDIEDEEGLLATLKAGTFQTRIADTHQERQQQAAHRTRVLVGTNHYPNLDETRDSDIDAAPQGVPLALSGQTLGLDENVSLKALRDAVRDGATLGDVLQELKGTSAPPPIDPLPRMRLAEPFERLRLRTERYAADHDGPPRVVLLPIGDPATRSARANFARNMFGVAGFAIEEPLGFESAEEGAQAAIDSDADLVVICSTDDAYIELAPAVCRHLQDADAAPLVFVAGDLREHRDVLESAGVNGFIHRGSPLLQTLEDIQHRLGVS